MAGSRETVKKNSTSKTKPPVKKNQLTNLAVDEISLVDRGAAHSSDVLLFKRDTEVQKDDDKARDFDTELLVQTAENDMWRVYYALEKSVKSIMGDSSLSAEEKSTQIDTTMGQFKTKVTQLYTRLDVAKADQPVLKAITDTLATTQEKLTKAEADLKTATTERDAAVLKAGELETEVNKLKAGNPANEEDPKMDKLEKILKRTDLDPETRAMLEEQRDALAASAAEIKKRDDAAAEAADKAALAECIKKAETDYKGLPVKAEVIGAIMHRVNKGTATEEDKVELNRVLKAAASGEKVTKVEGADGGDGTSAQARLDAAVADIQKSDGKLTREQAINKALEADPALYDELEAEKGKKD